MAKGLRSKIKRAFRTARRTTIAETPEAKAAEEKRQNMLERILEQGRAQQAARDAERANEAAAAPAGMDADAAATPSVAAGVDVMETDSRLKAFKKLGKGKRMKKVKIGLSGSNQFHRMEAKGAKARKQRKKNNPGYTIATSY